MNDEDAASIERVRQRLDTADLGPVRVDPNNTPARIVREALLALAQEDTTNPGAAHYIAGFVREASDYTLARLGRLLK